MIFQTIKNRPFPLKIALLVVVNSLFISATYADASLYVLDLREVTDSSINLEAIAKHSEGHLNWDGEKYVLTSDVKIVSDVPLELSGDLYVNQWNLVVESPAVEFRNFSLKSFSDLKDIANAYASGSVRFLSSSKNSAGEENPLSVSGKLSAILRGQKKEHGGSVEFPANANFSLDLEYDLRGGMQGGENGTLVYKINEKSDYAYQPEGIRSVSLPEKEIESLLNLNS